MAPVTMGMVPPPFYQLQLDAFTRHKVLPPVLCRPCWRNLRRGTALACHRSPCSSPYTFCLQVWSLEDLSSREHMHTGQTRCWERTVVCNLPGIYYASPTHSRWNLRPKATGREVRFSWGAVRAVNVYCLHSQAQQPMPSCMQIVAHYRRRFPQRFRPHEEQAEREGGAVFRVAFMPRVKLRAILNLQQVLEQCRAWAPPTGSPFRCAAVAP